MHEMSGERLLQERFGTTERAERFYERQVLDHLNPAMREFVERQEMMFVATSDSGGSCDSTLRAGPPGFVVVLDEHRLAWPEYRGNGVLASLGNIVENPHVGLLFVDFVHDFVGLHVNGRAAIVEDGSLRGRHPDLPEDSVPGRRAEQWVVAEVEEAYIHCSKHIPRLYKHPGERAHLTHRPPGKRSDYFVPAQPVAAASVAAGSVAATACTVPAGMAPAGTATATVSTATVSTTTVSAAAPATVSTAVPADHPVVVWRRRIGRLVGWGRRS